MILTFICTISLLWLVTSQPARKGPIPLTSEQIHRLKTWTEDDKQNIWELSGQFEGDIVLDSDEDRNGLIDTKYRWPNNEVPYEIDSIFTEEEKEWIEKSLNYFNEKTCIKVRPRTDKDKDYVYVTGEDTGCHSKIGRRGGKQTLNLHRSRPGHGCFGSGTIQHQFLHALGFYHQQNASDRDKFIEIVWQNIQGDTIYHFKIYDNKTITDFGVTYDYGSIMHCSEYAFSANGKKTVIPKQSGVKIGQRVAPSASDVKKLHKMYNCKTEMR